MERQTALDVFAALEKAQMAVEHEPEWHPPTYDVRLDATTSQDDERDFRIRVAAGRNTGGIEADDWRYVLDLVQEHGIAFVDVQNAGMELR